MILTDRFVYVHVPSTGGTFVTAAIEDAFRPLVVSGEAVAPLNVNKHGTCREIPASHAGLPVVANIRNPFDHYVAYFEYSWWRKHEMPGIPRREIREMLPAYPDIGFAEFVELASAHFPEIKSDHLPPEDRPGWLTEQFVRFFFRDPAAALASWERTPPVPGDMYDVRFLRNDRLTDDLAAFLTLVGFGAGTADRVRALGRVSPPRVRLSPLDLLLRYRPRRRQRDWRAYYTPELLDLVRHRERYLFEMFPEFSQSAGPSAIGSGAPST